MANEKRDGTGPWLRVSAWLPPGLALGWLATLATFVHGVGNLLKVWAATVSLVVVTVSLVVVLVRLLVRLRRAPSSSAPPDTKSNPTGAPDHGPPAPVDPTSATPSDMKEREADGTAHLAGARKNATTSASPKPGSTSGLSDRAEPAPRDSPPRSADSPVSSAGGHTEKLTTAELAVMLGVRVLTAAEVASVLRVDANVIVTAIGNGEFPGNRVGDHWRVDQAAVVRWLQGEYGEFVDRAGSQSSTDPRTDPT